MSAVPDPLLRSLPTEAAPADHLDSRAGQSRAGQGDVASITVCPDGPLLVRGDVALTAADGSVVPRSRRTLALCRCGGTGRPPLCDGTHKATGFRAP